mgnify:CR=1 FL=1
MIVQAEELLKSIEPFAALTEKITGSKKIWKKIYVSPLHGSSKSLLAASVSEEIEQIFILLPDIQKANETKVELDILGVAKPIITIDDFKKDSLQEKLTDINSNAGFILVSTYELLKKKIPSRNSLEKNTTKIEAGGEISYDDMMEYFGTLNYNKEKFVDAPGNFSVRKPSNSGPLWKRVRVNPGHSACTRTPVPRSSLCRPVENLTSAALVAE